MHLLTCSNPRELLRLARRLGRRRRERLQDACGGRARLVELLLHQPCVRGRSIDGSKHLLLISLAPLKRVPQLLHGAQGFALAGLGRLSHRSRARLRLLDCMARRQGVLSLSGSRRLIGRIDLLA